MKHCDWHIRILALFLLAFGVFHFFRAERLQKELDRKAEIKRDSNGNLLPLEKTT